MRIGIDLDNTIIDYNLAFKIVRAGIALVCFFYSSGVFIEALAMYQFPNRLIKEYY